LSTAEENTGTTRRGAFGLTAVAGVGAVLSGCSVYGASSNSSAEETTSGGSAAKGGAATVLAKTADIPVGGGKVFEAEGVVVTQPTKGDFQAFSTICTHQGCKINEVKGGTMNCPCHGSKFKIADGSVADGPAPKPLPAKKVTVDGDSLKLA
jgi:Rieske Fe-S protein